MTSDRASRQIHAHLGGPRSGGPPARLRPIAPDGGPLPRPQDRAGNGISLILYSMPYFVIGMPLIIIFAAGLHWFPTSGMQSVGGGAKPFLDSMIDLASHLALPLATVSLGLIGGYSILMRSSI